MSAVESAVAPLAVTLDEARDVLRMGSGAEDALLAGLLRSASALCEQFTGQALVAREVRDVLPVRGDWQRLALTPVRSITLVEGVPAEGSDFVLPLAGYAIDIDRSGDGWVKVVHAGAAGRVRVTYRAGLAEDASGVPEALRHGIIQLAGHLQRARDGAGGGAGGGGARDGSEPPAIIAALWRPWRRMRIS